MDFYHYDGYDSFADYRPDCYAAMDYEDVLYRLWILSKRFYCFSSKRFIFFAIYANIKAKLRI